MLLRRFLSAVFGVSILFATQYFLGNVILLYLCFFLCLIASAEFLSLFEKFSPWTALSLTCIGSVLVSFTYRPQLGILALSISFMLIPTLAILCFRDQEPQKILDRIQWPLIGLIYTGLLPALSLRTLYLKGFPVFLFLLVTVFFGDIGAYFSGKYFGKTKVFPNISPKKTIAGSIGGLLSSMLSGYLFFFFYTQYFQPQRTMGNPAPLVMLFCLTIGAFAQFGDFFESLIKRVAGKKDTSKLMPGHGGLLDRFDGVYFGSVVLYTVFVALN